MSAMAIGIGLTQMGRYSFEQYGYFYSGLQSFTFGVERLAKLIILYDYHLDNGTYPGVDFFKDNYGHKIDELINTVREINRKRCFQIDDSSLDNDIVKMIIPLLADFAKKARYYNLEYLSGNAKIGIEPLKRWEIEIASLILRRHYRSTPECELFIQELAKAIEARAIIWQTSEDGSDINSAADLLNREVLAPTKQAYSMFYLHSIAYFMCQVLSELETSGNFFPYFVNILKFSMKATENVFSTRSRGTHCRHFVFRTTNPLCSRVRRV